LKFWTGFSLLGAEGFSFSLGVLFAGLGISKLQFLFKIRKEKFFLQFFIIKTMDLVQDPDSHEMLDTDPDSQHWLDVDNLDPDPELFLTDFTHNNNLLLSSDGLMVTS
jgi:hypothetical protein